MISAVAFDFDGTLVRSNAIKRDCFHEVSAGIDGAAAVLDRLFAGGFTGDRFALFHELSRRIGADAPDPRHLADSYGRLCRRRIAAAPEVPGARATLERLTARGMPLYIVSATPQQALEQVVADRGLNRFFSRILGGPTGKADHLRRILAGDAIPASQLAVVGDGSDDKAAAAALGCAFFPVAGGSAAGTGAGAPPVSDLRALLTQLGFAPAPIDGGARP